MLNNRIVIPEKLKSYMMDRLYEAHTGIVAMKSVSHISVWWPSIDLDIKRTVKGCIDCNEH